ncbi:MAG: class I SAM-dependent methyltransferase [Elusimicrobiota bacterium]
MNENTPIDACPLCGGGRRPLFEKFGHRLSACADCETGSIAPFPTAQQLRELYTLDYFKGDRKKFGYSDYAAESANHARSFASRAALLSELVPGKGRILDLGCANGAFLSALGPGWEKHGVELSKEFVEACPPPSEVRLFVGDFMDYPEAAGSFDAVTLFDFLDHVPKPLEALQKAVRLLRPGGVLVVQQGDRSSLFARLLGKRWHIYIPPTHLWYFTRKGLHGFLRKLGLDCVRDVYEPRWASVTLCLFRLSYIVPAKWVDPLLALARKSWWGDVAVRFNFRDVVTVYAVKGAACPR